MRYYLREAQKEDAAAMVAIAGKDQAAASSSSSTDWTDPAAVERGFADPRRRFLVAICDDGEGKDTVVGTAEWVIPGKAAAASAEAEATTVAEVAELVREGLGEDATDMYGTSCSLYRPCRPFRAFVP